MWDEQGVTNQRETRTYFTSVCRSVLQSHLQRGILLCKCGFPVTSVYSALYILGPWYPCCHKFLTRIGSSQFQPQVLMESKVFLAVGFQLFVWDIVCLSPCVRSANDTIDHKSEQLPRKQNDNRCIETSLTPARPCGDGSGKFETGDFQHFPGFSATFVSLPSAFFPKQGLSPCCVMQPHTDISYFCVALKNPAYAEEVRSAAANEIRKKVPGARSDLSWAAWWSGNEAFISFWSGWRKFWSVKCFRLETRCRRLIDILPGQRSQHLHSQTLDVSAAPR